MQISRQGKQMLQEIKEEELIGGRTLDRSEHQLVQVVGVLKILADLPE